MTQHANIASVLAEATNPRIGMAAHLPYGDSQLFLGMVHP